MSKWADISWNQLQSLFSTVICVDKTMRIVYASNTVLRYLPDLGNKPLLRETFSILRPGKLETFADAIDSQDSLCLMTATNQKFAVRGQLIQSSYDNNDVMCFCGAPWLFWMSSNCPDVRLSMTDFTPQDVQLDQLFFMTTEKRMVADLENLNIELSEAKNELQVAHETQHRFFAQMSHEMRTPLNGVVSALSLLDPNHYDDRQRQLLTLAKSSSRNLMDVINYVLDLSKLELAGEEGESVFDLSKLTRSIMDILDAKAREKSLELRLELEPDLPQYYRGNTGRLRQVLLNLIMNAIKFTNKGSVTIEVLRVAGGASDCTLKFSVTDTGIGVADEAKQHIFKPFWSVQPEEGNHPDAGTGLGLDIVRRNVEDAGGQVGVMSELGAGSTFWFEWPLIMESDRAVINIAANQSAEDILEADLSGRVLLVDDNQTNLLLGTMILESMGVDVRTAENGAEAVAAALEDSFDLVLMDIHMPDFDGIEATRQIRKVKDEQDLPIVALTALAYDKEKETCIASGMNGYLTKPIVKNALAQELGMWLNRSARTTPAGAVEGHDEDPSATLAFTEVLDQAVLEELKIQIGQDNLKTVLTKVLTEATQRWEELIGAQSNGDKVVMQRHVHSLSSIFRSVGLMLAGNALAKIEIELRADNELESGWLAEFDKIRAPSMAALTETLEGMLSSVSTTTVGTN
ncbi:MAG: response regulator [Oceanicoccus sp.]